MSTTSILAFERHRVISCFHWVCLRIYAGLREISNWERRKEKDEIAEAEIALRHQETVRKREYLPGNS